MSYNKIKKTLISKKIILWGALLILNCSNLVQDSGKIQKESKVAKFTISQNSQTVINQTVTLSAKNQIDPVSYYIINSIGQIDKSTGEFTSTTTGTAQVLAIDGNNKQASATILIQDQLSLIPLNTTIAQLATQTISVSGGYPPYTYSLTSGTGTIDQTGLYTAPLGFGSAQIKVLDLLGNSITTGINFYGDILIYSSVALYSNGQYGVGGRAGTDAICQADYSSLSGTNCRSQNIHALVCISGTDEVRDFPTNYATPLNAPVKSVNGTLLSANFNTLMTNNLNTDLQTAGVTDSSFANRWRSGCGTAFQVGNNCNGFTSGTNAATAFSNTTGSTWRGDSGAVTCTAPSKVLCACW